MAERAWKKLLLGEAAEAWLKSDCADLAIEKKSCSFGSRYVQPPSVSTSGLEEKGEQGTSTTRTEVGKEEITIQNSSSSTLILTRVVPVPEDLLPVFEADEVGKPRPDHERCFVCVATLVLPACTCATHTLTRVSVPRSPATDSLSRRTAV